MHYDAATLALWLPLGVTLIVGVAQQAGWRHPAIIYGGITVGAGCILAALFSPFLSAPWLTNPMANVAASPSSWFTFALLVVALVLFSPPRKQKGKAAEKSSDGGEDTAQERAFKAALATTNARLDTWVQELSKKDAEFQDEIARISKEISLADLPEASSLPEAFIHLNKSVDSRIARISEEIKAFPEAIKWLERDSAKLIFFTVDVATLAVLEAQIEEGHRLGIPLDDPNVTPQQREEAAVSVNNFLRDVRSVYSGTHRGMSVENVLRGAETAAEQHLRGLPNDLRPSHIDLLDYRRLAILETGRVQLLEYLKYQRREKKEEIRNQRPDLLDRLNSRNRTKS